MAKFPPRKHELAISRAKKKGLYTARRRKFAAQKKYLEQLSGNRRNTPQNKNSNNKVRVIEFLPHMDLEENVIATLEKIHEIHKWATKRKKPSSIYINFKPIVNISPAAALLIAAELDVYNRLHPKHKLRAVDVHEWNSHVRRLLYEMGLFSLLKIEEHALSWDPESDDGTALQTRFFGFQRGTGSNGAVVTSFRGRIETFAGRVRRRMPLYDGLVEAMTNVGHHAYASNAKIKNWWISASVDKSNKTLVVR